MPRTVFHSEETAQWMCYLWMAFFFFLFTLPVAPQLMQSIIDVLLGFRDRAQLPLSVVSYLARANKQYV